MIESLKNGPENYLLTDEGYVYNYLGVDTKKKSYWTFNLLKSHLVGKIINHVRITVSESFKYREMPAGKLLLHKDESILARKSVWNYRAVVCVLIYL